MIYSTILYYTMIYSNAWRRAGLAEAICISMCINIAYYMYSIHM